MAKDGAYINYAALGEVELVSTESSIDPAVLAAFCGAEACIEMAPARRPHRRQVQ
jgi:hypothetical protein